MAQTLARRKAEAELLRRPGAVGHISVCVAPDGSRALRLLSPPDRPVPPALWAALAASEQAHCRASSPSGAALGDAVWHGCGKVQRKRAQPETGECSDGCWSHDRAAQRPRSGASPGRPSRLAGPRWSQNSQESQGSQSNGEAGTLGSRSAGLGSHSSMQHRFLHLAFPRRVDPLIPPTDPYLLNKERWPPAVKARTKCFVFPKPENRRFGHQVLYLCSSARRTADNLALQHAVWLASKLRMSLVVLVLLPRPLSSRLRGDRAPNSPAAADSQDGGTAKTESGNEGEESYADLAPQRRGRREMAELGALLELRKGLASLGIPLTAMHCSPRNTEALLQVVAFG